MSESEKYRDLMVERRVRVAALELTKKELLKRIKDIDDDIQYEKTVAQSAENNLKDMKTEESQIK